MKSFICVSCKCCYVGQIKEDEMCKVCGMMRENRNVHMVLVEKPEGTRPL